MSAHAPPARVGPWPAFEAVSSTKLRPPRAARRMVPREALLARLMESRRRRCILVQGPAGSGKTTMLVAWRQALLTLDWDVGWLSLAADDNEPGRFFSCLLASLAEVKPELASDAATLVGSDTDQAVMVERGIISVIQRIGAHGRDLMLMIEDLQFLDASGVCQALQWLLDYAPPNFHLALASRAALPLVLGRLRGQGQLAEFDLRDLRFSVEESERYLREQLGAISSRDAQILHELTDGWAAGLQLFAVDLKAKGGAAYASVEVRDADAFANYFEREVLVHLASDERALLMRLAVCNRFCASLCATLLGQPSALASAASRLARLDAENLFISQVTSHDRELWYRVHPLLREPLLARLSEGERRSLHGLAWRWFDAHGHLDEAVRHAVAAGEAEAAAEIVESCAAPLLRRGELVELAGLMRRLPPEQAEGRHSLRLAQCYLHFYARNVQGVEASLQLLAALPLTPRERKAARLLRAGTAMQRDDSQAIQAMRAELEGTLPDPDPEGLIFTGAIHVLAWMHMQEGRAEQARAVLETAGNYGVAPARQRVAQALLGLSYSLQGRMAEAEDILRRTLREVEAAGPGQAGVAALIAGLLADVAYETGELGAVDELLRARLAMLERAAIPDAVLGGMLALTRARALTGRPLEALACLDRLEEQATRQGLRRLLVHALAQRLRLLRQQGETRQAAAVLERLQACLPPDSSAQGTAAEAAHVVQRARAEDALAWGDCTAAATLLHALLPAVEATRRWREVAGLLLLLAQAQAGCGEMARARASAMQALQLGHRLGLVGSLLDAGPGAAAVLRRLQSEDGLDPVLAFYIQRLLAVEATTVAVGDRTGRAPSATPDAAGLLSEREREVLALVAQAMPNKKIARALGVTPHTVKWHLRKAYAKLGVSGRDEAVARLRDLRDLGEPVSAPPIGPPAAR